MAEAIAHWMQIVIAGAVGGLVVFLVWEIVDRIRRTR